MRIVIYCASIVFLLAGCSKDKESTLFELISKDESGIFYENTITENDTFNIITEEYIYNGGGVAIGDFNNDGLQDLFFSGNMVPNKLYINKGNLKFEDVSEQAGIEGSGKWNTGVAVADVNSDGLLDIYVCATMKKDSASRANILYINTGIDRNGIPKFTDQATAYGVDEKGYSMNAVFLDYDRDGDLDLYVLNNILNDKIPSSWRWKITDGTAINNDQLYRNNGNETFTNVTKEAGILYEGYGLGLIVTDYNNDGWPDLYVCNDYMSNDLLYTNNGDGTFTNRIEDFIRHQSQFSMGGDAADINNDGLVDLITLDMLPEVNSRKKTTIGGGSYTTYINNEKWGYQFQHVRNMLHLNNGAESGVPFSEIGFMSLVYQTDWSWSPLLADFDNDGHRDLMITNGFPKDVTDKDFANYRSSVRNLASPALLVDSIPVVKISNYAFKNNGDLTFTDVTRKWGMYRPSFSNGAAFADLDNDGDLDYVVNNINDVAFLYKNNLYDSKETDKQGASHFLRIKLKGKKGNLSGLGAKITLRYGSGNVQFHEHSTHRGYISTVEDIVHFGTGVDSKIDTLLITWPDGVQNAYYNITCDQLLTIEYKEGQGEKYLISVDSKLSQGGSQKLMNDVASQVGVFYKHKEDDKIDFNIQRTIPHKFSQNGPGMAVGDIDNNGLEDVVIAGSSGYPVTILKQMRSGIFKRDSIKESSPKLHDDQGLVLFDADNDGDLDLYVVTGSLEFQLPSPYYYDRFYRNNKGSFEADNTAIPQMEISGSCVRASDFDGDGDLDLFVGGRVDPGRFPYPVNSYILRNIGGKFEDATGELCSELLSLGMVTDALWSDFDNDGKTDLIIVGEFMPILIYKNDGNKFTRLNTELDNYKGWWNSITGGDFDNDGDIDYIAGNLGENNYYCPTDQYPLRVIADDFDKNGSVDAILSCYFMTEEGTMKLFPVHFWDELNSQSPRFRQQFSRYKQYSKVTVDDLFSKDEIENATILEASYMKSSYIENLGGGKFKITPLPKLAQTAPLNGIVVEDVNDDGSADAILVGNNYGNEVLAGRYDAFTGLILLGDGKGNFKELTSPKSGFYVGKDAKALVKLIDRNQDVILVASQNKDSLRVFRNTPDLKSEMLVPEQLDSYAEFSLASGKKVKVEFYYGSGYLSQSTRSVRIPKGAIEVVIVNSKGEARTLKLKGSIQ